MAAQQAEEASRLGTFGVGGLLLGPQGQILTTARNRVIDDGLLADPTAHGERQMVDWYFQQRAQGEALPEPQELTLISSLDPCMMCAGSVLASGMSIVILAPDDYNGVNYRGDGLFETLPPLLREPARQRFAYFGIEGQQDFAGSAESLFFGACVPEGLQARSLLAFESGMAAVKSVIHSSGSDDPETWSQARESARALLQSEDEDALSITTDPLHPGVELAPRLKSVAQLAQARGGREDAAALIDPFGCLLLCLSGQEQISPIRSPLMEIVRAYTRVRREVPELPHFKQCRLISLWGPSQQASSVADIGAYASTLEGPLDQQRQWQYVRPRQSQQSLLEMLSCMPALYSRDIRADIREVQDAALKAACQ